MSGPLCQPPRSLLRQQLAVAHELDGERLVTDLVEQGDHLVAFVALHIARSPLGVDDAGAERERLVDGRLAGEPRVAVVAVAARGLERLAEVVEDVRAAAGTKLRLAAHHVDALAIKLASVLLLFDGDIRSLLEVDLPICRR